MTSLRIPVELDVADMPTPKELLDKIALPQVDQGKRFLAVPARKLTTTTGRLRRPGTWSSTTA